MYKDIAPYDADGVLQYEWLNSRGAIPRFERSAMEVRLADSQECPSADVAVASAIATVLRSLINGCWAGYQEQAAWPVGPLVSVLESTIRSGEAAVIEDSGYLKAFQYPGKKAVAADLWRYLIEESFGKAAVSDSELFKPLQFILDKGTLARRIMSSAGKKPSSAALHEVYGELCGCLAEGRMFGG
jgi:hypothetical protein